MHLILTQLLFIAGMLISLPYYLALVGTHLKSNKALATSKQAYP